MAMFIHEDVGRGQDVADCIPYTSPLPSVNYEYDIKSPPPHQPNFQHQKTTKESVMASYSPPQGKVEMNPPSMASSVSIAPVTQGQNTQTLDRPNYPHTMPMLHIGHDVLPHFIGPPPSMGTVIRAAIGQGTANIVESLQKAIYYGDGHQAAQAASVLARHKANIKMDLDQVNPIANPQEKEITLRVKVEDKESSEGGHITLKVRPSLTIKELKRHMLFEYSFPAEVQRWVIGKRIPKDNETLNRCNIRTSGSTVYLYLMSAVSAGLPDQEQFERQQGFRPELSPVTPITSSGPIATRPDQPPIRGPPSSIEQGTGTHQAAPEPTGPVLYPEVFRLAPKQKQRTTSQTVPERPNNIAGQKTEREHRQTSIQETEGLPPALNRQPSVSNNEAGWECLACTFRNPATRPGCAMCAADRPTAYTVPTDYVMTQEELQWQKQQQDLETQAMQAARLEHEESHLNFARMLEVDSEDLVPNVEPFECPICYSEIHQGEGVVLRECLHIFCRDCLGQSVAVSEEPDIKCPYIDSDYSCQGLLQDREIKALVSVEVYNKFLHRRLVTAETQADNSYHCKTADCPGWCIYEDHVNFFHCPVCNKKNCLTCKVIHEGMNCKEYQDDIKRRANNDLAAQQTATMLQDLKSTGEAMDCPKCHIIVQKKDGCDWVKCSMCKTEICWVTHGPRWGPLGPGDTTGGCKCRVNGFNCHPQCQNCH